MRGSGDHPPLAWALLNESGAGEETERTMDLRYPNSHTDACLQTWAEYVEEKNAAYVGFWMLAYGVETRWDFTPDQARELAANLLVLADQAEHKATDNDRGES